MPTKSRRHTSKLRGAEYPTQLHRPSAWPLLAAGTGLVAVTLFTFWPVHSFDFVHYDDFEFIVENPNISTGLTARNVYWAWANPYSGAGGPLTWLSHMIDVELFGLSPGGHHVTSLIVHILGALVLLATLRAMTGSVCRSTFVAALFAIHPLHVESVAWIAERKDVLSGLFGFATLAAYCWYVRQPGLWRYLVVFIMLACGLLSKPMVATLPFLLLLLDVWPLQRFGGNRPSAAVWTRLLLEKLPLILLAAAAMWLTLAAQKHIRAVASLDTISFGLRFDNALVSYTSYLLKTAWPSGLIPFYPFRVVSSPVYVWAAAGVLVLLTAMTIALIRRAPYLAVGWFWFVGMLIPVIGLVQVGGHAMADRFTYLPLTGLFIAAAWGGSVLFARFGVPDRIVALLAIGIVAAYATSAREQTKHWADGLALWNHTIAVDPDNARAHHNRGVVLAMRGRSAQAIEAYAEALRLHPEVSETHANMALALEATGNHDAAAYHYSEALRIDPEHFKAHVQLANLLAAAGKYGQAITHFQKAVRSKPDDVQVRVNFAVTLGQSGRAAEALPHILEAVRLQPGEPRWPYFAAVMMIEAGRPKEAVPLLERVLLIDPSNADASQLLRELRRAGLRH